MSGPLTRFFQADHARLDALLDQALEDPNGIDAEVYARFRAGLLKHIALEEKLLLPAIRRARGGERLPMERRLRVDHGAIALLLVPSPTPELAAEIRSIIEPHNRFEEDAGGLYAIGDEILKLEADQFLEQVHAYPEVKVATYYDGPRACRSAAEALRISGKQSPPK